MKQIIYKLNKQSRINYLERKVNVYEKNNFWKGNFVEMIPYAKPNKGYIHILSVIDYFMKLMGFHS